MEYNHMGNLAAKAFDATINSWLMEDKLMSCPRRGKSPNNNHDVTSCISG